MDQGSFNTFVPLFGDASVSNWVITISLALMLAVFQIDRHSKISSKDETKVKTVAAFILATATYSLLRRDGKSLSDCLSSRTANVLMIFAFVLHNFFGSTIHKRWSSRKHRFNHDIRLRGKLPTADAYANLIDVGSDDNDYAWKDRRAREGKGSFDSYGKAGQVFTKDTMSHGHMPKGRKASVASELREKEDEDEDARIQHELQGEVTISGPLSKVLNDECFMANEEETLGDVTGMGEILNMSPNSKVPLMLLKDACWQKKCGLSGMHKGHNKSGKQNTNGWSKPPFKFDRKEFYNIRPVTVDLSSRKARKKYQTMTHVMPNLAYAQDDNLPEQIRRSPAANSYEHSQFDGDMGDCGRRKRVSRKHPDFLADENFDLQEEGDMAQIIASHPESPPRSKMSTGSRGRRRAERFHVRNNQNVLTAKWPSQVFLAVALFCQAILVYLIYFGGAEDEMVSPRVEPNLPEKMDIWTIRPPGMFMSMPKSKGIIVEDKPMTGIFENFNLVHGFIEAFSVFFALKGLTVLIKKFLTTLH